MAVIQLKTPDDVRNKSNVARWIKKLSSPKKTLTVGIHKKDNKKYPDKDVTTAEVGFWQEFGHTARGYRSFILPKVWLRIFSLREDYKKEFINYAHYCFRKYDTIAEAVDELGLWMRETIKDRIRDDEVTPHSKKAGTTLIDTGELINSIDYEVHDVS